MVQPQRLSSRAKVITRVIAAIFLAFLLLAALWQERDAVFPRLFPRVIGTLPLSVNSLAMSPDGRLVAACCGDHFQGRGEVHVWDF